MSIGLAVVLGITLLVGFLLIKFNSIDNEVAKFKKNLEYVRFDTDVVLTENELKRRMDLVGLGKYWHQLASHLRNDVSFKTEAKPEEEIPLGKSKIGGFPHLNDSEVVPLENVFFCQINCTELSDLKKNDFSPDKGMLYFFLNPQKMVQEKNDAVTVLYLENQDDLCLRKDVLTMPDVNPCELQFFQSASLPDYEEEVIQNMLKDYEIDGYFKAINQEQSHKLFGYPNTISQDFALNNDQYLLLQLDSEENSGMLWKNMGRLYVFAYKDETKKLSFKKIAAYIQSYEEVK